MQRNRRFAIFEACLLTLVLLLTGVGSRLRADNGTCNGESISLPFTDCAFTPVCAIAAGTAA